MQNGLREAGSMRVALRKRADSLVAHTLEEASLDDAFHGGHLFRPTHAAHSRDEFEECLHTHLRIGGCAFWQVAHERFRADGIPIDVVPVDIDLSRGRGDEAGENAHGC